VLLKKMLLFITDLISNLMKAQHWWNSIPVQQRAAGTW